MTMFEYFLKLIRWIIISYFAGWGVWFVWSILDAFYNKISTSENMLVTILSFMAIGGITISIYKSFNIQHE